MPNPTDQKFYDVGFSYPSSSNAKKFGFYETGCYHVAILVGVKVPKYVAAFATKEEAEKHGKTLGLPKKVWNISYKGAGEETEVNFEDAANEIKNRPFGHI